MRKRILLATVAASLVFASVRPAFALFGEGDIVFDPAAYTGIVDEVKNGLEEIKNLETIYTNARQQLQELEAFYNMFAHVTDVAQLVGILNSQFVQSPMLADALQLEQAFRGLGLTTSLAGRIQAVLGRVQYYAPKATDFAAKHLNDQATATAGQLTSAEDAYAAENARIQGLRQLQDSIATDDPKRIADLQVRAGLETASAISSTNKLLAAQLMQQAQVQFAQQQAEQGWRYSADLLRVQAQAAATASANGGTPQLVTR